MYILDHASDSMYDIVRHTDDYLIVEGIKTTKEIQDFIQNDMERYLPVENRCHQSSPSQENQSYQKVTEI